MSPMIVSPLVDVARKMYKNLPEGVQRVLLVRRRSPIWHEAGVVFIHVPKAAGTSLSIALFGRYLGHVRASDVERWASRPVASLPRFAVVRNPWDRIVSAYRFLKRGGGVGGDYQGAVRHPHLYRIPQFDTFERFVEEWLPGREPSRLDRALQPQCLYVCDADGKIILDHLGRFENLEPTIAFLRKTVGDFGPIGRSNRSGASTDYRSLYTPRLVDAVASIYSDDVRYLGYTFDG